jgi:hypothetical protein
MTRVLAFCAAVILSVITVSSACIATPATPLAFRLSAETGSRVHLSLFRDERGHHDNTSSSFAWGDLAGLDVAALRQASQRPLRFALIRDAGRVDCSGLGGGSVATGRCAFTPDPAFTALLESRGIGRPTAEQGFDLVMVGASRDLVNALASNHYRRPDIEKLIELAAVGINRRFVTDLAARGYAPASLDDLVEFAALKVSPAYIDALARSGYRNLTADQVTQMAALHITPGFIQGFARIGYANLPVETLVELKALDVTPAFVRSLEQRGIRPASAEKLAELKAVGIEGLK